MFCFFFISNPHKQWVKASSNNIWNIFLQFHNTSIYEFNDYSGTEWIRADQLSQDLASEFEKTIKFDYKYGKVDNIRVLATSSVFVNNIKKAMVNILHLTLKDQDRYSLQEVQINHFYPCLQATKRGTLPVFFDQIIFHTRWVHRELAWPLTCCLSLRQIKTSKWPRRRTWGTAWIQ